MKNRLARLLKVLEWYPRSGAPDVDALAMQLGTTPATVRRDLRELREAGAFDPSDAGEGEQGSLPGILPGAGVVLPATMLQHPPANDDAPGRSVLEPASSDDEQVAAYVGARFLAAEGDPETTATAQAIIQRVEEHASPELLRRLAEVDTRFRFGPRDRERRIRLLVNQAITERRVLEILYRGERDRDFRKREVEPLAQFFIHDRWTFFAYCRMAGDIRQFRHERCRSVRLTDQYFADRGGFSLESFIQQRRRAAGATRQAL